MDSIKNVHAIYRFNYVCRLGTAFLNKKYLAFYLPLLFVILQRILVQKVVLNTHYITSIIYEVKFILGNQKAINKLSLPVELFLLQPLSIIIFFVIHTKFIVNTCAICCNSSKEY